MIKSFISRIREYKKDTILAPLFMVLEVLAEVAIPFVMSLLIDKGIEAGDMDTIIFYGMILFGLAALGLVFGALSGVFAASAACGFGKNLRGDMFGHIQKFSFANIDKFSPSGLITRMTMDVINVQNAFQAIIRQSVRSIIMISAALVMVFNLSIDIAWIYLVIMPVLGFALFFIILKVHPIFERGLRLHDKLNNVVQENLRGIRVVKSFVRQNDEIEKFEDTSTRIYNDFMLAQKRVALNPPLIQLCVYASMILISWIGARLVVSGNLSTGQMMSFFTYTMQLLMNLMLISIVFVMIIIAKSSAKRIIEVLEEEPSLKYPSEPVFEVADGSVRLEDVGFSYVDDNDKLCLSCINLDIKSGETIGIIGGTGSSKTSLIQLIPRLYDTTCGSLSVGGVNVRDYDISSLRNAVAVVLQKNTLFSGTIKENLRWGDENATDEMLVEACRLAQADGFIQSFPNGYDTYIEQGGANVSGGQRQRLCIARALLKKPKVLILDDSTSAVDTKTDAALRKAFRESLPDTTKIIIAQRISSVMDADRIVVMEDGGINEVATHEALMKNNEIYKQVYATQIKGGGDFDEHH